MLAAADTPTQIRALMLEAIKAAAIHRPVCISQLSPDGQAGLMVTVNGLDATLKPIGSAHTHLADATASFEDISAKLTLEHVALLYANAVG